MTPRSARIWHGLTAAVAVAALVLQLVLVLRGGRVLDETEQPGLGIRLGRLVSYFTIQSNLLVAVVTVQLARDPLRDGAWWRVLRLAAVSGILVTGVVHFILLRPLLDLDGADRVADTLLHQVVPVLAVVGWAVFGPRPRIESRDVAWTLVWPLAWLVWTLVVGGLSGWYPYPFLDHREDHGTMGVVLTSAAITVFFVLLLALARQVDQRTPPAPQGWDPYRGGGVRR
ncbi:Pr6Pr family membrane protein [Nocardioides halotolerans]|uniref:Pr6Pr family membrane protein n=1 Tax=Nocardioides halotolerans TaxID=433660 RepID=UPI0003FC2DF6|nr:Pr6Pr family membrane protein [Nocardioides halotolerans]